MWLCECNYMTKKKSLIKHILPTGMTRCYDADGRLIDCSGTGQDAALAAGGSPVGWTEDRFTELDDLLVQDKATWLLWTKNSCPAEYPLNWQESLAYIKEMNETAAFGRTDWRMPNRRELRSLIDHSAKKPALPVGHPFEQVFLGWYWTSTTAAIAPPYAWYVHLAGGRMFYGNKDGYYWLWPVCGQSTILLGTGADSCYDIDGHRIDCVGSGQDGALQMGAGWPAPRFVVKSKGILDTLTGLTWWSAARYGRAELSWQQALDAVADLARETGLPWRMPTINELESLVDAARHSPALPADHPFNDIESAYWSSTTSGFETDWAYVLYMTKGAVGVGFKKNRDFALWPVMTGEVMESKTDERG